MRILVLLLLTGCVFEKTNQPIIQPMPASEPCPASASTPQPVWPGVCVSDWYAQAKLPSCVEAYFSSVKAQQKSLASGRK